MDKLIVKADGSTLISNDGATILQQMNVLHPAAKMLVELSKAQDIAAGDGTTTVTVLAGALLDACGSLLQKGIHPGTIASSFLAAAEKSCQILEESKSSVPIDLADRESLLSAVETCLSSKVVSDNSDLLAPIAVDSVLGLLSEEQLKPSLDRSVTARAKNPIVDLRNIRLVEQVGGTVDDTELVDGLVLNRGASKSAAAAVTNVKNAKIALIQYCLTVRAV